MSLFWVQAYDVPNIGTMEKSLHTSENQKLLSWLRSMREERHLTMRDLAGKMNKPHSFIAKVEQGERRLDVVEFVEYCNCLGVSPFDGMKHSFSAKSLKS